MVKENLKVFIKPERGEETVIKKVGGDCYTAYPVVGTTGSKLLVQVGVNLIDIFPSWVTVDVQED